MAVGDVWYRIEGTQYSAGVDEFDEPLRYRGPVGVHLSRHKVLKETPKGVWVALWEVSFGGDDGDNRRFVLRDSRKRFACPTIAEAEESFKARKNARIRILSYQIDSAREMLQVLEREKKNWKP